MTEGLHWPLIEQIVGGIRLIFPNSGNQKVITGGQSPNRKSYQKTEYKIRNRPSWLHKLYAPFRSDNVPFGGLFQGFLVECLAVFT
jgi:hypothetical protein